MLDYYSQILIIISCYFLTLFITGWGRKRIKLSVSVGNCKFRDEVIELSGQQRALLGLQPSDAIELSFPNAKTKRCLHLEVRQVSQSDVESGLGFIPLQDILNIYDKIEEIPEPAFAVLKISRKEYIKQSMSTFIGSWFALFTGLFSIQGKNATIIEIGIQAIIIANIITIVKVKSFDIFEPWKQIIMKFKKMLNLFKTHNEITGSIPVLITAPHITRPASEVLIKYITEQIAEQTGAYALLGTITRTELDLNREEALNTSFRKRIFDLVESGTIHTIIDLHGAAERESIPDIDIGTAHFTTSTEEFAKKFKEGLEACGFETEIDAYFKGKNSNGNIISIHADVANGINAIQVEISRKLRQYKYNELPAEKLVNCLVHIIRGISKTNN